MTTIEFRHIHDILVTESMRRERKCKTISIRDIRGSDVDIVMTETDADFLRTVLNERFERGTKDDPENT